jgi:hypothetical protein
MGSHSFRTPREARETVLNLVSILSPLAIDYCRSLHDWCWFNLRSIDPMLEQTSYFMSGWSLVHFGLYCILM